jgi:hypothetical protein
LTVVQGRPVVVDPAQQRAGWVGDDAAVDTWACFPQASADQMQLLGSAGSARVYAGVPQTGTLEVSDLDTGRCGEPIDVSNPGNALGPLVESEGFVLVPNETTGQAAVVDIDSGTVAEDLAVLPEPGGRLELVARDGLVFYNDLAGERAGVLGFDGSRWTVGAASQKFVSGATGLAEPVRPLPSGSGAIPPDRPPVGLPPPRGQTTPVGPGRVPVTPTPTTTVPATPTPATGGGVVQSPNFDSVVNTTFENARFYIDEQIKTACKDGSLCLAVATQVRPGPVETSATPCTIVAVPPPGPVPRGSTLTFTVDRPCAPTPTPTATTSPTPTPTTTATPTETPTPTPTEAPTPAPTASTVPTP